MGTGAAHAAPDASPNWRPPVINVSALKKEGVAEFWKEIERYREVTTRSGEFEAKRKKQALDWMWSLIETGLHGLFETTRWSMPPCRA